jgi:energy-coupling factor transporter transmembrane protein EcfT
MKFYEYVYRDSFVHNLDPRVKLAWLFVFSSAVFLTSRPSGKPVLRDINLEIGRGF